MADYTFRQFDASDSLEELTALLHRAYAAHKAAGRNFVASFQTVKTTGFRISKGECWLMLNKTETIGTVIVRGSFERPEGYPAAPHSGTFNQFAVVPEYRAMGLGSRLLTFAESRIKELGTNEIVIDTSELAVELIAWYERRGYVRAGSWKWKPTNYDSVVLRRTLG